MQVMHLSANCKVLQQRSTRGLKIIEKNAVQNSLSSVGKASRAHMEPVILFLTPFIFVSVGSTCIVGKSPFEKLFSRVKPHTTTPSTQDNNDQTFFPTLRCCDKVV